MGTYSLSSAWAKLTRAREHIEEFKEGLMSYFQSASGPIETFVHTDGNRYARHPIGQESIWPELTCSAGDALHNMRCVLDHIAYALAEARNRGSIFTKKQLASVAFPILATRAAFKTRRHKSIDEKIGADWAVFLRGIQPYQRGNTRRLLRLTNLDNMDKHRALLALASFARVAIIRAGQGREEYTVPIKKGAVDVRLYDDEQFRFVGPYAIFADAPLRKDRKPADMELDDFHDAVYTVYREAQARFF